MTLFEKTIPKMSYDIQQPREYAKEFFQFNNSETEKIISDISEDNGETICSRSLIMLLKEMNDRIKNLETEIQQLKEQ